MSIPSGILFNNFLHVFAYHQLKVQWLPEH